jgi:mono/diheme cytochrome c family protein
MEKLRFLRFLLLVGMALAFPSARAVIGTNIVFDATSKEYNASVGEMTAEFDFSLTNTSLAEITVSSVRASCGCTTPKLPSLPWVLAPGTNGSFHVTVDLRGKAGTFSKTVTMETTEGPKLLSVKVNIPNGAVGGVDARTRNQHLAMADRQRIFKDDCASCHKPAANLMGEKLFVSTCGICHEAEQRATSVPELHALKAPPTEAYWEAWIRYGKAGTMMPAFAHDNDGPLSDEQVGSLVKFLVNDFPKRPVKHTAAVATPTVFPPPQAGRVASRTTIPALPTTLQGVNPPQLPAPQNAPSAPPAPPVP